MSPAPLCCAVLGLLLTARAPVPPPARALTVTEGHLEPLSGGRLRIDTPRVRAVAPEAGGRAPDGVREAELRFTYQGPTARQVPLGSGAQRRQVGLKLRARDGCNVVYVMWRLAPVAGLVVSVKSNPGQSRSDDCGNGGYATVKPREQAPVPALVPGAAHTLHTRLAGARLWVQVDGLPVWEGELPAQALAFDGPTGLRADNGRFDVELRATP